MFFDVDKKIEIVNEYRAGATIKDICDKYNISKATLTQWNKTTAFDIEKKIEIVNEYRAGATIKAVCDKYNVSKATLMRWNKHYNGEKQSLENKSHAPKGVDTNIRIKVVNLYLTGKYSLSYLSKLFGVSFNSITRWCKEYDKTAESLLEELN